MRRPGPPHVTDTKGFAVRTLIFSGFFLYIPFLCRIFASVNKMSIVMKIVNTAFFSVFDATGSNVFTGLIGQCEAYIQANMGRLLSESGDTVTISTFDVDTATNTVVPARNIINYTRHNDTVYVTNNL